MNISDLNSVCTIVCHNGLMHSDDVLAAAFLSSVFQLLDHPVTISRMNGKDVIKYAGNPAYLIFDAGGGRYDHHDKKHMQYREGCNAYVENGFPYAAFGLLWKDFGKSYLTEVFKAQTGKNPPDELVEKFFQEFDRKYASVIDNRDNNGPKIASNISDAITAMNGRNPCDSKFMAAVSWAKSAFDAWINSTINAMEDEQELNEVLANLPNDALVLELEHHLKLSGDVHEKCPHLHYVIYPSIRDEGYWNITALADSSNKTICPFIPNTSLYQDVTFVHPNGFMVVCKSKEAAINACLQNEKLREKSK